MTHTQSLTRATDAGCRPPSAVRRASCAAAFSRLALTAFSRLAFAACLACFIGGASARAQVEGSNGEAPIRLRSFAPGASARLEVGTAGGRSRLSATNLPRPDALTPDARAYVVWATGGVVRRLGVLRRGAGGAGAFEFAHPAGLSRYGVVVTAEVNADTQRPSGAPVFSTRALEVAAVAAAPRRPRVAAPRVTEVARAPTAAVAPSAVATAERSKICVGRGCAAEDFDGEVRRALGEGGARTLRLVAARGGARRSRGVARVVSRGGSAYARLRLNGVPAAARFGARRHVLWAVTDGEGPVYMGSLPPARLNGAQTLVRTEGVNDPRFRLLVTAERGYPSARPAGRRVLLTFKGRRARRRRRGR